MKNKLNLLGFVLSIIGILGNSAIFIYAQNVQVPVTILAEKTNGTDVIRDEIIVNSFFPFLSYYNLYPIFIVLCSILIVGISILVLNRTKKTTDIS